MKTKLRTEIITQTIREITFRLESRGSHSLISENCKECSAKLLTLNEAVQVSSLVWDEIVYLIKAKEIHFNETVNGEVYVCVQSLSDFRKEEN